MIHQLYYTHYNLQSLDAVINTDGRLVVKWKELLTSPYGSDAQYHLLARLFSVTENSADSDVIQVNSTKMDDPKWFSSDGASNIAALGDGRFVVVWSSADGGDGSQNLIRGRIFSIDGNPLGNDFRINTTGNSTQFAPNVIALPDGGFVVSWSSLDQGLFDQTIRARIFDSSGSSSENDFFVSYNWLGRTYMRLLDTSHFFITRGDILHVFGTSGTLHEEIILDIHERGKYHDIVYISDNRLFSMVGDKDRRAIAIIIDEEGNKIGEEIVLGAPDVVVIGTSGPDTINSTTTVKEQPLPTIRGDKILGLGGSDLLDGGDGNDLVLGGSGDDRIFGGPGADLIRADAGEDILLGGSGKDQMAGGSGDDIVDGGGGDDRIRGNQGTDKLIGGGGRDWFVFDFRLSLNQVDRIIDFVHGRDKIVLEYDIFDGAIDGGQLRPNNYCEGRVAGNYDDRIVYNIRKGVIYFDADGDGRKTQIAFAKVEKGLELAPMDFIVIDFYT